LIQPRAGSLGKRGDAMIYIGSFLHLTNQEQTSEQERRHGEFSLLIEASSSDEAVYKFRGKIVAYRMSRDFFEGDCDIFFSQLLEFRNLPSKEPIMFNYHSFAGDPVMPYISCSLPSEVTDSCRIVGWNESHPEIDEKPRAPFLSFKEI
jgi:hypothetical protein